MILYQVISSIEKIFLNAERKKIFNQKTNGGNGNQLKILFKQTWKKIKNFSNKDNTDFIFSNIEGSKSNVISTNKIISDKYIEIENYLDENFKPFWKYTTKEMTRIIKESLKKFNDYLMSAMRFTLLIGIYLELYVSLKIQKKVLKIN